MIAIELKKIFFFKFGVSYDDRIEQRDKEER